MNLKTKAFDCVAESRKWREAASAKLNAMSAEEERTYLQALGERVRSQFHGRQHFSSGAMVLREEPAAYGVKKP